MTEEHTVWRNDVSLVSLMREIFDIPEREGALVINVPVPPMGQPLALLEGPLAGAKVRFTCENGMITIQRLRNKGGDMREEIAKWYFGVGSWDGMDPRLKAFCYRRADDLLVILRDRIKARPNRYAPVLEQSHSEGFEDCRRDMLEFFSGGSDDKAE